MTDFAEHPRSLGEVKANRDHDATQWSPRDVLIYMLREIDARKIEPTALVVSYQIKNEEGVMGGFNAVSAPDKIVAVGLLTHSIHLLMNG